MKRKARIQTGIDDRLVAIYARKSRITNKGDSIGVQFKQSADYAINQLSLPEDYEFARYEDKGLSGYYSDRPDFQRLLRDIEMGKIKAVACYKLDRISRKTSDLMRLLEYFERHDVTLLVCSNNINTRISTSKIIIQVLAIIAEFERDILTERIQDNLMELAKDGRWLGGKTPTGFSSQRVTTGSGKNKSAISFLVPVQEEKEIVLEIYSTFWETRSLLQTANIISEKYETKHGAKFTTSTIRLILRNPIYCVADEYSYNYFLEHDGNLFGEPSDFDGQHGLTAYNKTDQMKVEDEDSTFFNPKFSQLLTRKPISEWIVSVGRHEGFISSRKWVETQNMLDEIAEKYNRPHRKTNALLSGLMYCPICGKRLRVLPESNRWTNGKPRFKYACPGVRAKECAFKGVEGVTLDEFVIHSLSSLQEEHSDYYRQLLENRVASMIRTDQSEKEYQETQKAIERLNADIAAQVRNLREADDALKRFIQDDIKELTDELAKREAALRRMEDTQSENQYLIHELNGMKKRLLSFEEFAKDAQPEALFTLVHSIVDRIYITTDGTKQKCQVYIKGCATEDYSDVLGAAGYIEEEPLLPVVSYMPPMCDLDYYSIGVVVLNITRLPEVLASIVVGAFNPKAFTGGAIGSLFISMQRGVSRGIFSNEAGLGTGSIAHACADTKKPVKQGVFGIFEVFVDTIVICTLTALVILCSGTAVNYGTMAGADLTISGFTTTYGSWASIFSAVALCCFAFSTIIGWGLYGSRFVEFLFRTSKAVRPFLVIYSFVAILGATVNLDLLWNIADTFNGLMSIPNLIALLLLSGTVVKLTKEFFAKEDGRKLKK